MKLTLLSASKGSNYYKHVEKTYNFRIKSETGKSAKNNLHDWEEQVYNHMINRVGKMCVAAMSLCMIVLIVTRKREDGRY
jgi:hypothetical protein